MKEIIVKSVVSIAADIYCRLERMIAPAEALISSLFIEGKFETCIGNIESNAKGLYALYQRGRFVRGHQ